MKIKTSYGIFNLLPCPCCGKNRLYVGVKAACEMGVSCCRAFGGCGIEVNVEFPDKTRKPMSIKDVEKMCLEKAIKIWNKRVNNETI